MGIKRLSAETIKKIAAGEVIECPTDIVKELVENAIDAKPSRIFIDIRGGFQRLEGSIRVVDDGVGIAGEDFNNLFERHSTSKIVGLDDLLGLNTLGFRGEALASIGAVCRVELASRIDRSEMGNRVVCDNGKKVEFEPCAMPEGTIVNVKDIFKHLPARLKFLKTDRVELNKITHLITHIALFYNSLSFELVINGARSFYSPSSEGEPLVRIADLFGYEIADAMTEVIHRDGDVRVEGFISAPDITRGNSRNMYIAVNGRPVNDREIIYAILNAYKGLLPDRRYPTAVVNVIVPTDMYDVNVHPRKSEVRFRDVRRVTGIVYKGISRALSSAIKFRSAVLGASSISSPSSKSSTFRKSETALSREDLTLKSGESHIDVNGDSLREYKYVGYIGKKYVIYSGRDDLYIVDQHATAERLLFNQLVSVYENGPGKTQVLLIPKPIYLSPEREQTLSFIRADLERLGYDFDEFGDKFILLRGIPSLLPRHEEVLLLEDILDGLDIDRIKERGIYCVLAEISCHKSLRSDRRLSPEEADKFFNDLLVLPDDQRRCPHGRRLMMVISEEEMDRYFGRR